MRAINKEQTITTATVKKKIKIKKWQQRQSNVTAASKRVITLSLNLQVQARLQDNRLEYQIKVLVHEFDGTVSSIPWPGNENRAKNNQAVLKQNKISQIWIAK